LYRPAGFRVGVAARVRPFFAPLQVRSSRWIPKSRPVQRLRVRPTPNASLVLGWTIAYVVPRSARLLYTGAARFIGAQPRRRSLSPIHLSRVAWRAAWCRAVRLMQLAVLPRVLAIVLSRMCLGS